MIAVLAVIAAGLLLLGACGTVWPQVVAWGTAALCTAALVAAVLAIAVGGSASIVLPAGPPGGTMMITLDPLAAFFVLPLCLAGGAVALSLATPPLIPVFIGAMLLTLLAGDRTTIVLGLAATGAAGWGLVRHAGFGAVAALAPVAVLLGLAVLAPGPGFDAMRAAPPDGWRAAAVLVLTVLGMAPMMALAPLHRWWTPVHDTAPAAVAALLTAGMVPVGAYVLIRTLLDLSGAATPAWWGAPLLAMGAATAVLGSVRANQAPAMAGILAGTAMQNAGFVAIGLGVALAARGADLPALASLAVGGAMLHALNQGLAQTLAILCADAARQTAATGVLDRLGGLARSMPVSASCLMVAAAALAQLPLTAGFAGFWLLLQTVIGAPRIGGLGLQLGFAVVAAAMALAAALSAAAMLRLAGIGFLGRPRTPRAAAAEDPPWQTRTVLCTLAGLCTLLGLLPGIVLAMTAAARRGLSAAALREPADWAGLDVAPDLPGYLPLGLILLLGVVALAGWLLARRFMPPLVAPAWDGGLNPPPPWLPFGDPATQADAAALEVPVMAMLGGQRWWRDPAGAWITRAAAWFSRPALVVRTRWAIALLLALAVAAMTGAAWLDGA